MLGSCEAKRIENNEFRVQIIFLGGLVPHSIMSKARRRVDFNTNLTISQPPNTQKHGQFVYICMKCMSVEEE